MDVVILYNPNSTGDSERNARELADELRSHKRADLQVTVQQTKHAGHGEEIAHEYALKGKEIILISSSGDGGYHELINGALSSKKSKVITGLLPSGNANDHHSALARGDIARDILEQSYRHLDTLKITATVDGKAWTRYAHSYAGIGISAVAADDMTRERPNVFSEKWLLIKSLFSFTSVKVIVGGHTRHYSSVLFSNISRMSKVLTLSDKNSPVDGKFEINSIRLGAKPLLIFQLLLAATIGLKSFRTVSNYRFTTARTTPIQLDGEVYHIDAGSEVTIESVQQNLCCVL